MNLGSNEFVEKPSPQSARMARGLQGEGIATSDPFAARQTHWITLSDGAVSEHDAVRDDLGMAKQLGWLPPSPVYVARMLFALARERSSPQLGKAIQFTGT